MEITARATASRLKPTELESLLTRKGFRANSDYGWKPTLNRLNKLTPRAPRDVEIVFFRPTEEEWKAFPKSEPEAYKGRGLRPASLFEIMALLPDNPSRSLKLNEPFCEMLGGDFSLHIHGHYTNSWLGRDSPVMTGRYGWKLDLEMGLLTPRTACFYAGYRKPK